MRLLEEDKQKFLKNTFPCLSTPVLFEDEGNSILKEKYDISFVSAFDHWLTVDECEKVTMCFSEFKENEDQDYLARENRFMCFYEILFDVGVYPWEEDKDLTSLWFKGFDSKSEYMADCLNSIREKKFLNICVPDLQTVVCGGFDLTQKILTKKGKDNSKLIKIAKESSLYLLS